MERERDDSTQSATALSKQSYRTISRRNRSTRVHGEDFPSSTNVERRESAHLFFSDKTITEHKSNTKAIVLFVSSLSSSSSVVLGDDDERET
jgi:hypothetical protein